MNFRVLTVVREEIAADARSYNEKREGLGVEFLDLVEGMLGQIEADPRSLPLWEHNFLDTEIRRGLLRRFQYVIYYQIFQDEVVVVSVAHGSRDYGSWIKRIRRPDF